MASSASPGQTAAQHMAQRHQALQAQQQAQQPHASAALSDPSFLSAQQALSIEDSPPVRIVQMAPLVRPPRPPCSGTLTCVCCRW